MVATLALPSYPHRIGTARCSRTPGRVLVVKGSTLRVMARRVLDSRELGGYLQWCVNQTHHTPLTGPRASIHKVLPPPLVVSTEETQRPHSAGRLAPRIRRPVIRFGNPAPPWGELCPDRTRGGSDPAGFNADKSSGFANAHRCFQ